VTALPAAAAVGAGLGDRADDVWVVEFDESGTRTLADQSLLHADLRQLTTAPPVDTGRGSSLVTLTLGLAAAPSAETLTGWVFGAEGTTDVQADARYSVVLAPGDGGHAFFRVDRDDADGLEIGCPGARSRWTGPRTVELRFDSACIRAPERLPAAAQVLAFLDRGFALDAAPDLRNGAAALEGREEPSQPPAFTLALPGAGTTIAPTARDAGDTCADAPRDRFPDTAGNVHAARIDCAAHHGITTGRADGSYAPGAHLLRGQVATFLVNTLRAAGTPLPDPSQVPDHWEDDDGTEHEKRIDLVSHLGLMSGSEGRFRPHATVSRADMAEAVSRALGLDHDQREPAPDFFHDDDGRPAEPAIGRVAQEGIVTGKGGGRFAPGETLRRDQMATFLVRLLDALS
jgi:hypothetical protein